MVDALLSMLLRAGCHLSVLTGIGKISRAAKAIDIISEARIDIAGIFVVAITRPAALGAEFPCPAANHLVFAALRSSGILLRPFLIIIHFVIIVAPLPYVSMHIIQAPGIGPLFPYRLRFPAGVILKPCITAQL